MSIQTIDDIKAASARELLVLWGDLEADRLPQGLSKGQAFEYLVVRAFEIEGADVTWPFTVPLEGSIIEQIDGVAHIRGIAYLLESKNWSASINAEPLHKLRSQLLRRPSGTVAAAFSREGFTEPARMLATYMMPQAVLLWDGPEVLYGLENACMCEGMRRKLQYAVEYGFPYLDIRT